MSIENEPEDVFSKTELGFLCDLSVPTNETYIDGVEVWRLYKGILFNKTKEFTRQQIDKKIISGILSKFTFSIFSNASIRTKLTAFSIPSHDDDEELRGFDNYFYLARHEQCYDYKSGLLESQFEATENFIL